MSDKAAGQKTRSPEGCDENGPAAALLVGYVSIQICALLAPCRRPILIATKAMLVTGQDTGSIFEAALIQEFWSPCITCGYNRRPGSYALLNNANGWGRSVLRLKRVLNRFAVASPYLRDEKPSLLTKLIQQFEPIIVA